MNKPDDTIWIVEFLKNIFFRTDVALILVVALMVLGLFRNKISALYQYFIDNIRIKTKSKAVKKAVYSITKVFSSPVFTAAITVVVPYLIDKYNSQINVITTIWILLVFLNVICSDYIKGRNKAQKWFLTALRSFKRIQRGTARKLFDTRQNMPRIINSIIKSKGIGKELEDFYFRFDTAAEIACEEIYQIIKDVTGYTEHQVTVYRRFQDKNGKECPTSCPLVNNCINFNNKKEWTRMVACHNKNGKESMSREQEHCFEYYLMEESERNSEMKKQHFYIKFFSKNKIKMEIVTGKDQIKNCFLFHESCRDREEKIEQYIGIPLYFPAAKAENDLCADVNNECRNLQHVTYAVLQIDFKNKGILGKTDQSIQEFVENVFRGIIDYLDTALQVEETLNGFLKNISNISNLNQTTKTEFMNEYDMLINDYNENVKDYNDLLDEYNVLEESYKFLNEK